ncbi:general secretion pathway protein G [Treponema primitia ZAS-2]|uniref:General secretion pathway protein G n=1 Tax=Treponema primitia (strain ATCC BAA-887 / DSM 12427 / ZAS-2) TaxID=545694 RepID=F5YQP7_TREPZ|nr:type II secretion system major pseudopilin GspG [Treponema primitia]AEF84528.1 general secretion pathway protein G [Treponema primitia ZAS-2]
MLVIILLHIIKNRKNRKIREDKQGGWTFIETLIVIGIILVLTSSVGFMAVKYLDRAKVVTARSQIETLALSVDAYFFDCGQYPQDTQGLSALWEKPKTGTVPVFWNGPYINKPLPKDPWGNDYEYLIPGYKGMPYGIRSLGGDGCEGGTGNEADLCSWE